MTAVVEQTITPIGSNQPKGFESNNVGNVVYCFTFDVAEEARLDEVDAKLCQERSTEPVKSFGEFMASLRKR